MQLFVCEMKWQSVYFTLLFVKKKIAAVNDLIIFCFFICHNSSAILNFRIQKFNRIASVLNF